MAAIKGILESPTMPTIWVKEATRRKLVRSKVKNMEMSLQVSFHWQSVTWDYELLKPQVFSSFRQTKPLQRRRKAKRIKRTWQNSLLIRSILSFCSSQLCGFVSNKTHVDFFFLWYAHFSTPAKDINCDIHGAGLVENWLHCNLGWWTSNVARIRFCRYFAIEDGGDQFLWWSREAFLHSETAPFLLNQHASCNQISCGKG